MSEAGDDSALHDNIRKRGKNSYYYAHRVREGVEIHEWDQKPEPRLLKTQALDVASAPEPTEAITTYAWSDGKKRVTVYVSLEGIGSHPEDDTELEWTASSINLRIRHYNGKTKVLSLELYDEISDAIIKKRKPDQLVLWLSKEKEISWFTLKKSPPS